MLTWGRIDDHSGVESDNCGEVLVDVLKLTRPADRWRYRLSFSDPEGAMIIRRVALNLYTAHHNADSAAQDTPSPGDSILPVPFYSQWQINGFPPDRVCSPTALAMVAAYHGVPATPESVARIAYDEQHQIYGNWAMNILAASRLGLDAWVDRGTNAEYLYNRLAENQPLVVSIAYGEDELAGAPVQSSKGHLVVVAGIDRDGRMVVRDPAARGADVWIKYDRDQFVHAWLGHGGVVYRIAGGAAR